MVGKLDGVGKQVVEDLGDSFGVALDFLRGLGVDPFKQLQPLQGRIRGAQGDAFLHQLLEPDRLDFNLDVLFLHLGKVQDVIDDAQKVAPRNQDAFGEVPLFFGLVGGKQQFGHAQDAVEGGTDLVAHGGDKGGFGIGGGFGGLFFLEQLGVFLRQGRLGLVEVDVDHFVLLGLVGGQGQLVGQDGSEQTVEDVVDPLHVDVGVTANVAAQNGKHLHPGFGDHRGAGRFGADHAHLAEKVPLPFQLQDEFPAGKNLDRPSH